MSVHTNVINIPTGIFCQVPLKNFLSGAFYMFMHTYLELFLLDTYFFLVL
ncbi:hypothetical protein ERICIV_00058 [Paenibacillus larvae subsp. larvae]|uniref:Uncharacterized protein n=1 Tax=Paenibacillus larvae subsp. larvae TaxID=147375 RepID=A0A2L1U832_9BACL|nr:hypothetical protein ERICIII_00058 [Paenibacillus larvae subsp. larvae]AVF29085.1 hypothetical protein ERICIV_00058 [Paenibacillus larvae subsp. larvae]